MLVKTSLTQSTKPINNVNVIQNIYSKKWIMKGLRMVRPGTALWLIQVLKPSNLLGDGRNANKGGRREAQVREAGGSDPPVPPPLQFKLDALHRLKARHLWRYRVTLIEKIRYHCLQSINSDWMNLSSRRSLGWLKGRGEFEGPNCQKFKCLGGGWMLKFRIDRLITSFFI